MKNQTSKVVIVGGGSAGWLCAGLIAAERGAHAKVRHPLDVVLIESPDVPTIGVGEGTWPSMRTTLKRIGLSETQFIRECDASFKQGTFFRNWLGGNAVDDAYSHPFTIPSGFADINLAPYWLEAQGAPAFADAVTPQTALFADQLAPKQITTPEYAFVTNYGYHLDAGKFAELLRKHCTEQLGVTHVKANVLSVNAASNDDIASVSTDRAGNIAGDLFVDCTGSRSLLLGDHYQIPFQSMQAFLFNDSALAVQVPYSAPNHAIQSCTLSTAQTAGWIWDIGLPTRRGIGHVFSSAHLSEEKAAEDLLAYIRETAGNQAAHDAQPRHIRFQPGHRQKFWHNNCVAIGMSAGFIEPLEASALVMVEQASGVIAEQLPPDRDLMQIVAKRFNAKFLRHWSQIIDFLKLHYVLSARVDSPYWQDNRETVSIPDKLTEQLKLWRYRSPWHQDAEAVDELFPTASYQYILYGMGFKSELQKTASHAESERQAADLFTQNAARAVQFQKALPTNRELINKVAEFGFQKL